MALDWNGVFEKVVVGLIISAVVGVLALFWNWSSQGGLVHVLGGVTSKEVDDLVKKQLPSSAVVAFDLPGGCPIGWATVDSAIGRAIVGAATKAPTVIGEYSDYPGGSADVYGTGYADGVYGKGYHNGRLLRQGRSPTTRTQTGSRARTLFSRHGFWQACLWNKHRYAIGGSCSLVL